MTLSSASNPFVGLRPFESDESLLFFGRQEQTLELLHRLHKFHFVAVTGNSGSGKSSLIRAGLIPRLKAGFLVNDFDKWIISVMKPGQSPLYNFADAITSQVNYSTENLSPSDLRKKIFEDGVDAVADILAPLKESRTNFFLLIDQFEELFRFSENQNDIEKIDEAVEFVNTFLSLSANTDFPVYIVITMRSDFIGDCANFFGLAEGLNQSQYVVPRLNRVQLRQTIEGPIQLFNGEINSALTARMLNDAHLLKDELPLLQHALMRTWEQDKSSTNPGKLDFNDYNKVGGLEKALSNHADEALNKMSEAQRSFTKKIFQALTGVDENGRKVRRPVHLSELQSITSADKDSLLSIINAFIEDNRSFLIINKTEDKNDVIIDISHESLIRQWNVLNNWVNDEADSAKVLLQLSDSAVRYAEKKKDLLSGNELHQVLDWYYKVHPGKEWAARYSTNYDSSIEYLQKSESEEKKQRRKRRRNRTILFTSLIIVIAVISILAISIYRKDLRNRKALALNYWKSSEYVRTQNNFLDGLHFIAEATIASDEKELIKNLLIDAEACLPNTALENIFPQNDIINSAVFSADRKRILIASNNGSARILDAVTGGQIVPDMRHESPVNSAVFSPDDKWVLTTSNDNTARIWDASTGKQVHLFKHDEDVPSATFSPNGKFIVTGSSDSYARVWDISTERVIDSFEHVADVACVVFSPDGKKILTASNDGGPHIWSLVTKKELSFLPPGSNNKITILATYNNDGSRILTINSDSTVDVFDSSANKLASFRHPDKVTDAVFSPDGKWVLTSSRDKLARLWDLQLERLIGTEMKHAGPVYSVAFKPDGKQIITTGWDKTIRLWDIASPPVNTKIVFKQDGKITCGNISPDSKKILTAGYDSTARLWDITGKSIYTLKHFGVINSAVFSFDGSKILTAGNDSTMTIWDEATGKQLNSLKLQSKIVSAAFSHDAEKVLAADYDNYLQIWNTKALNTEPNTSIKLPYEIVKSVFSPDGKSSLVAGGDSAAHLIDLSTMKERMVFKHENIEDAAFSVDGKNLVTAGDDYTARVWDVASGRQIGTSMKHNNSVKSAALSSDGKWILTSGWDNQAHLWYTSTLQEIGISKKHSNAVTSAIFSKDDKHILTTSYDSTACLWDIEGDIDVPASLFNIQAKALTGVEYNTVTGESECISLEKWRALKEKYNNEARDHYKNCKYPQYNVWHRFYEINP